MKRYKLLKDLPTFLIAGTPENQETTETGLIIMIYHETTLKKFPNILTEWFEEIKEPVDSIHWKPKYDDWYFYISDHGSVCSDIWNDNYTDNKRLAFGFVYRTEEEAKRSIRENREDWMIYFGVKE